MDDNLEWILMVKQDLIFFYLCELEPFVDFCGQFSDKKGQALTITKMTFVIMSIGTMTHMSKVHELGIS